MNLVLLVACDLRATPSCGSDWSTGCTPWRYPPQDSSNVSRSHSFVCISRHSVRRSDRLVRGEFAGWPTDRHRGAGRPMTQSLGFLITTYIVLCWAIATDHARPARLDSFPASPACDRSIPRNDDESALDLAGCRNDRHGPITRIIRWTRLPLERRPCSSKSTSGRIDAPRLPPALDGLSIVQIFPTTHFTGHVGKAFLPARVVRVANELQPDSDVHHRRHLGRGRLLRLDRRHAGTTDRSGTASISSWATTTAASISSGVRRELEQCGLVDLGGRCLHGRDSRNVPVLNWPATNAPGSARRPSLPPMSPPAPCGSH